MLRAILNKSWWQHPTRHQLYGHLPPITKTIQVRRTRHAGEAGRPARTYIQQLCEDTECSPEDQPEAMNDREKWREMVRDICASGTTWWWHDIKLKLILFGFCGISTLGGYLMPTPLHTHIKYNFKTHFIDKILKWAWALFLHRVK